MLIHLDTFLDDYVTMSETVTKEFTPRKLVPVWNFTFVPFFLKDCSCHDAAMLPIKKLNIPYGGLELL